MSNTRNKTYLWNEETINYFQFTSSYVSGEDLYDRIQAFVETDCVLEDGDNEEDLVNDLFKQITSAHG